MTSLLCLLTLRSSPEYRYQLTVLGERMAGINGPFLVCLALLALLAGVGLLMRRSGGWNVAMLAGVMGLVAGGVMFRRGGLSLVLGGLVIVLGLLVLGYLIYGPVVIWFHHGPPSATPEYERVASSRLEKLLTGSSEHYEPVDGGARRHDLFNWFGMVLLAAYGIVYVVSLFGPAREFSSSAQRFTISAPPGWVVASRPQSGALVSLVRPDSSRAIRNQPSVSVYVEVSDSEGDDLSSEEIAAWDQEWIRRTGLVQDPVRGVVSVSGLSGHRIILDRPRQGTSPERWMLVALKREGRIFTLRCAADASIFGQTLPEFQAALDQFQFMP